MSGEKIIHIKIEDEMKDSYIDYSMSVIVSRALPDVRDGLKPVHRRVLFGMSDLGLQPGRSYKKSARIVGEVLGKYHPHGDTAVYDSIVRMAQNFSLRYPLVQGQGNFGSVDGDSPAAMRYTEVRLFQIAAEMLKDIDKNTIDYAPNFDDSLKEPIVLPSAIPNLLINGASGIAVGMATNIPPHNISEVINGVTAYIDNPKITNEELMTHIKAPDFPTAGIIYGYDGVKDAYTTGRGKITIRAKASIVVNEKTGKESIVITEIPYQVNKAKVLEKIAVLINAKKIEGIADLRDESDRDGMRVVIDLKKGVVTKVVLNQLFKHTQLQETFGVILLALVKGLPKILTLSEMIGYYVEHRHEVLIRKTKFELDEAEKRAHILEGLKICLDNLDEIIKLIRSSKDPEAAKSRLMSKFKLSDLQAKAILDMRLQRLTNLEREKIETEYKEIIKLIEKLKGVLGSKAKQMLVLKEDISAIKKKYADPRRTEIVMSAAEDLSMENLIAEEDVVITISNEGYIKRTPLTSYRRQGRGGRGVTSGTAKGNDVVEHIFISSTHNYLLLFTTYGKCHWLKVFDIPEATRTARGRSISNLIQLLPNERVLAYLYIKEFKDDHFLLMATKKGHVKKTSLSEYAKPRRGGIIGIKIEEGKDELIGACVTDGDYQVVLAKDSGRAVRFHESNVRPMGRNTTGVTGISLGKNECVVSAIATRDHNATLLTVTNLGFGKRSYIKDYRMTRRGASGVITLKENEKVGKLVKMIEVRDTDDIIITTKKGLLIRQHASDMRVTGRNTSGVKVIRLGKGDEVVGIASVQREEESDA